jgi:hypothetical protein
MVEPWNWAKANGGAYASQNGGGATAEQTLLASYALYYKRAVDEFSHLVWNDMVIKAGEVIMETTGRWDETYANYHDTKMWTKPYKLTAKMFNSLRNNIDLVCNHLGIGRTGIGRVYTGDDVYAEDFFTLTRYINYCIEYM